MVRQPVQAEVTRNPLLLWPCQGERSAGRGKVATPLRAAGTKEEMDATNGSLGHPLIASSTQMPQETGELEVSSEAIVYPEHSLTPHQRSRSQDSEKLEKETQTSMLERSALKWAHPASRSCNSQASSPHQKAGRSSGLRSSLRQESGTQTNAGLPDDLVRIIQSYWMELALKAALKQ